MGVEFLSVAAAAREAGMTEAALRQRINRGRCPFPVERVGRAVLIPATEFRAWAAHQQGAATP